MGFLGPEAIATKPIGNMKFMDWAKAQKIVDEHPNAVIVLVFWKTGALPVV